MPIIVTIKAKEVVYMYEIVVLADKVYRYPTTWKTLPYTAYHVGVMHKREIVSVWKNGNWFMDRFAKLGVRI